MAKGLFCLDAGVVVNVYRARHGVRIGFVAKKELTKRHYFTVAVSMGRENGNEQVALSDPAQPGWIVVVDYRLVTCLVCEHCTGKGHVAAGKCFACRGKGWLDKEDRKRHSRYCQGALTHTLCGWLAYTELFVSA